MAKDGPIILIDDDEHTLMLEVLQQQKIPNPLIYLSSGEAAIRYLLTTQERPFLILCDMNLPVMDGIEVRKRIHENEYLRLKSIPFVFYTTSATPHAVNIAYEMSVQGFFKKGFDLANIGKLIHAIYTYWSFCEYPMI